VRTARLSVPYRTTMKITGSLIVCAAAGLFTAGALILDDGPARPAAAATPPAGTGTQIEISGFAFAAAPVPPGSTVVAANRDAEPHTVTAADGSFDSGQIPSGNAVAFVAPAAPGTYQIVCTIHPSMSGQLVVA
jgi:plastocyanin